jgi:hypothetical protein
MFPERLGGGADSRAGFRWLCRADTHPQQSRAMIEGVCVGEVALVGASNGAGMAAASESAAVGSCMIGPPREAR